MSNTPDKPTLEDLLASKKYQTQHLNVGPSLMKNLKSKPSNHYIENSLIFQKIIPVSCFANAFIFQQVYADNDAVTIKHLLWC